MAASALAVFIYVTVNTAQAAVKPDTIDVREVMAEASASMLSQADINAVSIGVYVNNKSYTAHYGELIKGSGVAPNDDTIYEIGSSGKTVTGALVAKAVTEGKLSLSDKVTDFLPQGYANLSVDKAALKISHLLTHTGGTPNILPIELEQAITDFANPKTPYRMNEILASYSKEQFLADLKDLRLSSKPGAQYQYSSAGTELLAYVIEQVYKKDFEAILADFLGNLGLQNTKVALEADELSRLAPGYHLDSSTTVPSMKKLPWGAGGSIKSTVPDMLRFIQFQLDGSNAVSQESQRVLYRGERNRKLAYQWNVSDDPSLGPYLIHHGGVPSAQNYLLVAPEKNVGVFIITNQSGLNTPAALEKALNMILERLGGGTEGD